MRIINGNVLLGNENRFVKTDMTVEDEIIKSFGEDSAGGEIFDAEGMYVISGFIDTHIHGCVGVEFASPDEDFTKASEWLASEGVTSYAATVRAMTPDRVVSAIKNIVRESKREVTGACVRGINLEGPFVSKTKSGVMNPPDVECAPDTVALFSRESEGLLKIMTLAPERESACLAASEAVRNGVKVSVGHTDATFVETKALIDAGATRATHVFNAMRPLSHRETGVLGAVLTDNRINCEMICDFVHLDPAAMEIVYRLKGYKNITLVSDTGFMSGLGDGEYVVDGRKRIVKDGICRNSEGRIAGSCVSMLVGAKNLLSMGVPLEEISVMASLNPAKALGIEALTGSIELNKKADLIVCDKELNIKAVFISGRRVK